MRYALLIYERPGVHDGKSAEELEAITREYMAMYDDARVQSGAHLKPVDTATVVREDLVTDGPFADTKEIFGGFFLIDAEDLDAALEIAATAICTPPARSCCGGSTGQWRRQKPTAARWRSTPRSPNARLLADRLEALDDRPAADRP